MIDTCCRGNKLVYFDGTQDILDARLLVHEFTPGDELVIVMNLSSQDK